MNSWQIVTINSVEMVLVSFFITAKGYCVKFIQFEQICFCQAMCLS